MGHFLKKRFFGSTDKSGRKFNHKPLQRMKITVVIVFLATLVATYSSPLQGSVDDASFEDDLLDVFAEIHELPVADDETVNDEELFEDDNTDSLISRFRARIRAAIKKASGITLYILRRALELTNGQLLKVITKLQVIIDKIMNNGDA